MRATEHIVVFSLLIGVAACNSDSPQEPFAETPEVNPLQAIKCNVAVSEKIISCTAPMIESSRGASLTLIGGQGKYLMVNSSNTSFDPKSRTWSTDLSITNLSEQPLGTEYGSTAHKDGVRLFLHHDPSNGVLFTNPDGYGTFTASSQPYIEYAGLLRKNETSTERNWQFAVPEEVESFQFAMYVKAEVPEPGQDLLEPWTYGPFKQLVSGVHHTCGLTKKGATYCWGYNKYGQLGDGSMNVTRFTPTSIKRLSVPLSIVSSNAKHTCGLTETGEAYCWGENSDGQLGDGTINYEQVLNPKPVSTSLRFAQITTGLVHTCGLTEMGEAYCWGDNYGGQIGDGTHGTPRLVPTPVSTSLRIAQIAAGTLHTCGLTGAGEPYCWGYNHTGQLGDGTTSNGLTPTPEGIPVRFVRIISGQAHSCGLTGVGEVYCWGANDSGQLGDNSTDWWQPLPTLVETDLRFAEIIGQFDHTCGLTDTQEAYCWGRNSDGEISGDAGDRADRLVPTRINTSLRFTEMTVGAFHICGLTNAGMAFCWGSNKDGQLGDGTTELRLAPTPVAPLPDPWSA